MTDGRVLPALLTAPVVVVNPTRALFSQRSDFSLFTPDREVLARVVEAPGSGKAMLGNRARVRLVVSDPDGLPLFYVDKPSGGLRASFLVRDSYENEVGTIEQDNALLAPRFTLAAGAGSMAHLSGGGLGGGVWTVATATGVVATAKTPLQYGGVSYLGNRGYVVELHPDLAGPTRALVLLSVVCLDVVRVIKRRRSSS
jgi:hypothetical protein